MLTAVIPADGAVLDRLLTAMHARCNTGLDRDAYGRFHAARMKTAWGCRSLRAFAVLDGTDLRAGALRYDFAAVLDGRPIRVCGIGSLFTEPAYRGHGHARRLIDTLLDDAARDGADIALLFSRSGDPAFAGFEPIGMTDTAIEIVHTPRPGAPMTLVRGGEARDLAAIVAMGETRAAPFRFHLDRDVDLVHYAITAKRLLAGLGPADARHLQFFIAEEGITAAAYVVVTIAASRWTIEECGDRDPSGARVGALLQALIAREPVERRPTIGGWLPSRFVPPQVTATTRPSTAVMMIRSLNAGPAPRLSGDDVLYWRGDIF
jgi:GNAT superfamily N-acetyltransferase